MYGWGDNKLGQACPQFPLAVCSIPKQIVLPVGEVAYDITALNDQVWHDLFSLDSINSMIRGSLAQIYRTFLLNCRASYLLTLEQYTLVETMIQKQKLRH